MTEKYITLVGSRSTPIEILHIAKDISSYFANAGYIGRSGAADGFDSFSRRGYEVVGKSDNFLEFLPWAKFNNSKSKLFHVSQAAQDLARSIHPTWFSLNSSAKLLHSRNCFQVLGQDLKTPSELLIAYTSDGEEIGGTRTAIMLANKMSIPVWNLGLPVFENARKSTTSDKFTDWFISLIEDHVDFGKMLENGVDKSE